MSSDSPTDVGSYAAVRKIDEICDRFESALRAGDNPSLAAHLAGIDAALRPALLVELVALDLDYAARRDKPCSDADLLAAHPSLRGELAAALAQLRANGKDPRAGRPEDAGQAPGGNLVVRCPFCHEPTEFGGGEVELLCAVCGGSFQVVEGGTLRAPALQSVAHFELVGYLGAGTFGTVWKARDTRLDRVVAVKIPRSGRVAVEGTGRFLHEARAAAQLNHPNIVQVHEVGHQGPDVYIVQDLVRGVPLSDWMRDHRLTFHEAARICVGIAEGLQHAHEHGVVHRDIKPANIMIDHEGQPRITDFGLAKREAVEATVSLDGRVLGTPAYMAPEQAEGDPQRCDARADIYSLGTILFQLLTGELPFRGNARMLIHQLLHHQPPSPRKLNARVPKDLETICLKCLEKDPRKRYASAQALADDLGRYLRGEPIAARPVTALGRAARWCRREPLVASLLGVLAVLVGGAAGGFTYLGYQYLRNRAELEASQFVAAMQQAQAESSERREGYRARAWRDLETALHVGPALVAKDSLRQVAAGLLGDFVGNEPLDIDCSQFPGGVTAVALHPLGKHVAVGFGDGAVRLFDPQTGAASADPLDGGPAAIRAVAFAPQGSLVAVNHLGTLHRWPLGSPLPRAAPLQVDLAALAGIQGAADGYDLTADGRFVLAWQGARLVLIEAAGAKVVGTYSGSPEVDQLANAAYCPETDVLVASYQGNSRTGLLAWRSAVPDRGVKVPTRVGFGYRHSLALSGPTAKSRLLAVGGDNGVELFSYDPDALEFAHRSYSRTDAILAVDFAPDGQYVGTHEIRGRIELLRPATGRPAAELLMDRSPGTPSHLAFSNDGRFAASFNRGAVRVWLLPCDEKLRLAGHADGVPCLAFTRNGRWLLSGGKDGLVSVWDTRTGQEVLPPLHVGATIQTIALSPDDRLLATGEWDGDNGPIKIWDFETRQLLCAAPHVVGDPNRVAFGPEGGYFAAGGPRGVCLWRVHVSAKAGDPPQLEQLGTWPSSCRDLVFDGERALVWNEQRERSGVRETILRKWDLKTGSLIPFDEPRLFQGWHTLAMSPDSGQVTLVAADRHGETWDCRSGALVRRFGPPLAFQAPHIALSGGGRLLAGLSKANEVALWSLTDNGGRKLFSFRPEANNVYSLAWSPAGDRLAVGLADGGIAIWNVAEVRQRLDGLGLGW